MHQSSHPFKARTASLVTAAMFGMGMLACATDSVTGDEALTSAFGVPGQVVFVSRSLPAGRLMDSVVIDSAGGRWSRSWCAPVSGNGAACTPSDVRTETGTMEPFQRVPLFERARRYDFEQLRRNYRRTSISPPFDYTYLLHVVQNGRRRTVSWDAGAELPPAVESFLCKLQAAQGAFIQCAD